MLIFSMFFYNTYNFTQQGCGKMINQKRKVRLSLYLTFRMLMQIIFPIAQILIFAGTPQ